MGLGRVMWTGCLGMCCLVPMAWISMIVANMLPEGFNVDLMEAVTNGLITNLDDAIAAIFNDLAAENSDLANMTIFLNMMVQGLIGVILLIFFPIHWILYYRPDNVGFALVVILPWIFTASLTSALFCKEAKKGFDTGMGIGCGYALGCGIIPGVILMAVGSNPQVAAVLGTILSLFEGLTDIPFPGSIIIASLEGGFIGGVFGAFVGALKYDPDAKTEKTGKKAKKAKKAKKKYKNEPQFSTSTFGGGTSNIASSTKSSGKTCSNCGNKLKAGDPFCPNCGSSI